MKVTHQFYQKKVSQILLWFSENSRKCPSMAFFNNLATFRIVNNQIFIFVYKIIPLETNSTLSKNSNTEMKVTFPSERQNLANNSTELDVFECKSSKRHLKLGPTWERLFWVLHSRNQFDEVFSMLSSRKIRFSRLFFTKFVKTGKAIILTKKFNISRSITRNIFAPRGCNRVG